MDILTYLWRSSDNISVYPTSHKSGIFKGVPIGTTHFLHTLGEEMYTQGIIDINPNTNEERNLEQRRLLETTYNLDSEWIAATLALSTPECTHIQDELRIAVEKKAEKEEEKQRMEIERAALKKTLEKVSEAEEREHLWEKMRDAEQKKLKK